MAAANEPDNTPLPGTVFTPRQVRILKIAVIVMGILLVVGFGLVMAAIVYQASQLPDKTSQTPKHAAAVSPGPQTELAIPQGAKVTSLALDGDRLALHLESSAGPEVVVVDIGTGKVLSRIKLKAE
jgi:hypothetical protein